jgi:hypothetical protein
MLFVNRSAPIDISVLRKQRNTYEENSMPEEKKDNDSIFSSRSRIHGHIVLLRFQGIILRVLRLEVLVYNVNITNQFQATFAEGEE